MPAAALIGPIIGAAGALGGAAISSHAAGQAGKEARGAGIQVGQSIDKATQQAIDAGYYGLGAATDAVRGGLLDASGAVRGGLQDASNAVAGNYGAANTALGQGYSDQMAQLAPWLSAGQSGLSQLMAYMAPGGQGQKRFDASMMYDDPGYQFRLDEGTKNMLKSASARGGLQSGGFAKALDRYSQDYASNEYANAFDRYMKQQTQQYNMLSGLAGYGQHATDQAVGAAGDLARGISGNFGNVGNLLGQMNYGAGNLLGSMNYGAGNNLGNLQMQGNQYIGNTGLAGAEAAGNAYMGGAINQANAGLAGANAWGQGVGNAAGTIGGALGDYYNNKQNAPLDIPMITQPATSEAGAAPNIAYTPPSLPYFLQPGYGYQIPTYRG